MLPEHVPRARLGVGRADPQPDDSGGLAQGRWVPHKVGGLSDSRVPTAWHRCHG
jgi:hypothetical protein